MKVLFLATDMFARGGISRYTATWASVLGKMVGPENLDALLWFDYGYCGQSVTDFRLFGPLSNNSGGASKLKVISRSLWAARKRYDLVIANHAGLALVAGAIRLLWGTPYWVACYGHEAWQSLPAPKLAALRGAELVIAISRFTAEKLEKVNGIPAGKIHLLYNAVPRQLVSSLLSSEGGERVPNLPDGEKVLLSVGDMSEAHAYKGFDTVIRALPKILRSAPNCRYLIVGQGRNRSNLAGLAGDVGVADHVTFAGAVSDAALVAFYRTCAAFVMPSRALGEDGASSGEGLGYVYLEAALAGKPVVGSREGGAAEAAVHGKTGFLVNPRSVDDVAEAVLALLGDPELAARMGAAGRQWALENFTEEAFARTLERLLRLSGHRTES